MTWPPKSLPRGFVCAGRTTSAISDRDALTGFGFSFEFWIRFIVLFFSRFIRPRILQFWNVAFHPYTTVAIMTDQKKTRRQVLEEFVRKSPADAFSRYGLAMECMTTGDASAAIHNFNLLLAQHADYIPAYLMYGQLLVRESRPEEAKQILATGVAAAEKKGDQHAVSEMEALLADIN
jgi:hypothetical protein